MLGALLVETRYVGDRHWKLMHEASEYREYLLYNDVASAVVYLTMKRNEQKYLYEAKKASARAINLCNAAYLYLKHIGKCANAYREIWRSVNRDYHYSNK